VSRAVKTASLRKFAMRVRTRREELDLSQREAARRAGIHYNYWGSVERAERNLAFHNIVKIARALRVDPGDLMRKV
jgi:transcriptional regulator with XRE-family HTH domain